MKNHKYYILKHIYLVKYDCDCLNHLLTKKYFLDNLKLEYSIFCTQFKRNLNFIITQIQPSTKHSVWGGIMSSQKIQYFFKAAKIIIRMLIFSKM